MLSEKQITRALDKYYLSMTTELEEWSDEWYANPAPNIWKFERDGKIHRLTCDPETGVVTHT